MKERINRIMQEEKMNASQFSDAIGVQRAAMSHILTGRNNPSLDIVTKILGRFPSINPDWLLHGTGEARRMSSQGVILPLFNHNEQTGNKAAAPLVTKVDVRKETPIPVVDEGLKEQEGPAEIKTEVTTKETVIYSSESPRKIDKLLIFYSDSTYESFIPEKKH